MLCRVIELMMKHFQAKLHVVSTGQHRSVLVSGFPCSLRDSQPVGAHRCPHNSMCMEWGNGPHQGFASFDNILLGILVVFQCITLEGWSAIYYLVRRRSTKIALLCKHKSFCDLEVVFALKLSVNFPDFAILVCMYCYNHNVFILDLTTAFFQGKHFFSYYNFFLFYTYLG